MPKVRFVLPLVFSGAIALLMVVSAPGAVRADDCLPAPNGQPGVGEHWYYRTDRASGRKCWYLRERLPETNGVGASMRPGGGSEADDDVSLTKAEQEKLFADFMRWRDRRRETH